jgi:hypothetical protein
MFACGIIPIKKLKTMSQQVIPWIKRGHTQYRMDRLTPYRNSTGVLPALWVFHFAILKEICKK